MKEIARMVVKRGRSKDGRKGVEEMELFFLRCKEKKKKKKEKHRKKRDVSFYNL